jgi:peroxiredoxin
MAQHRGESVVGPDLRGALAVGDVAPPCSLAGLDGRTIDVRGDDVAGHPLVLAFCPRFDSEAVRAMLAELAAAEPALREAGAKVYAITAAPRRAIEEQSLTLPILQDRDGAVFSAFGAGTRDQPTLVVVRQNCHVAAILKSDPLQQVADAREAVLRVVDQQVRAVLVPHPPVLVVPDVLSPADCRRLIQIYETRGKTFVEPGHGDDHMTSDYKMRIPEYGRGDRIDHWLVDRGTVAFIDGRLSTRLFPEIRKAFQYRITQRERMRIGCYTGSRGGELHGHRDDTEILVAHRRFAMSLNLNFEEFEGGELRFPEYGNQLYSPATGAAIVFSCSILHEAQEVRAGRRFVLLAFLYGDH